MKILPQFALTAAVLALTSSAALAHPHETDKDEKTETKKSWPYFGESKDSDDSMTADEIAEKIEARIAKHADKMKTKMDGMDKKVKAKSDIIGMKLQFDSDDTADDLREAGKAIEEALAESGMISGIADMMADLAEDFDVEDGEDGLKVFKFDGKKMGHFKLDSEREETGRMNIGGLGQNLSIERETYVKDGKTKTRIVIEMDGGEDVDIELPELDKKVKKKVRIRKEIAEK